jgi:hypothetical protein
MTKHRHWNVQNKSQQYPKPLGDDEGMSAGVSMRWPALFHAQ